MAQAEFPDLPSGSAHKLDNLFRTPLNEMMMLVVNRYMCDDDFGILVMEAINLEGNDNKTPCTRYLAHNTSVSPTYCHDHDLFSTRAR